MALVGAVVRRDVLLPKFVVGPLEAWKQLHGCGELRTAGVPVHLLYVHRTCAHRARGLSQEIQGYCKLKKEYSRASVDQ